MLRWPTYYQDIWHWSSSLSTFSQKLFFPQFLKNTNYVNSHFLGCTVFCFVQREESLQKVALAAGVWPTTGAPRGGDNTPWSNRQCLSLRRCSTRSQRHRCLPGYPDTVMPFNKNLCNIWMLDKFWQQKINLLSTVAVNTVYWNVTNKKHQPYRMTC